MLAQALKKHIFFDKLKSSEDDNKMLSIPRKDLKKIIVGFLDDDEGSANIAPYSIQKIAVSAFNEFKHKPGEWYNPSNINFVLEKLHNTRRVSGAENLEILISNDGMIFLDKILEKLQYKECDCDCDRKLEASLNICKNQANKNKDEFLLINDLEDLKRNSKKSFNDSQNSNGSFSLKIL